MPAIHELAASRNAAEVELSAYLDAGEIEPARVTALREAVETAREVEAAAITLEQSRAALPERAGARDERLGAIGEYIRAGAEGRALTTSGSSAGDIVPTGLMTSVIDSAAEAFPLVGLAQVIGPVTGAGTVDLPKIGDLTPEARTEVQALTATDPSVGKVSLAAQRVGANVQISQQLLYQSPVDLSRWVVQRMAEAVGRQLAAEIIAASVAAATTNTANDITIATSGAVAYADLVKVEAKLPWYVRRRPAVAWLAGPAFWTEVNSEVIGTADGRPVLNGNWRDPVGGRLTGHQMFPVDSGADQGANALTTAKTAAVLSNIGDVAVVVWGAMEGNIIVDPYTAAANGQVNVTLNFYAQAAALNDTWHVRLRGKA